MCSATLSAATENKRVGYLRSNHQVPTLAYMTELVPPMARPREMAWVQTAPIKRGVPGNDMSQNPGVRHWNLIHEWGLKTISPSICQHFLCFLFTHCEIFNGSNQYGVSLHKVYVRIQTHTV